MIKKTGAGQQALAVVNGTLGDHLVRRDNGLALPMTFIEDGVPCALAALPRAARVVVLVHGMMNTETVWRDAEGSDFGTRLHSDAGLTPLYLRYNTGRAIADNGAEFAMLLEELVRAQPQIEEIVLLGFSLGGLVTRAACHVAATSTSTWLPLLRRCIYIGTPHRGAPLERGGRVLAKLMRAIPDPYAQLAAQIGDLRSDGIKDLGDADLTHEHREARAPRLRLSDPQHPVPLLMGIAHYLVGGRLLADNDAALRAPAFLRALFGDAIVSVPSSTHEGEPALEGLRAERVRIVEALAHYQLPTSPAVYAHVRAWCAEGREAGEAHAAHEERQARTSLAAMAAMASMAPLPPHAPTYRQGAQALLHDAVEHGTRAVERVQLASAGRVFFWLERVPPIATHMRAARGLYDTVVHAAYEGVRAANRIVAVSTHAPPIAAPKRTARGSTTQSFTPRTKACVRPACPRGQAVAASGSE